VLSEPPGSLEFTSAWEPILMQLRSGQIDVSAAQQAFVDLAREIGD
jgi:hypothetical protein